MGFRFVSRIFTRMFLRRSLPSTLSRTLVQRNMSTQSADYYVAVKQDGTAAASSSSSVASELPQLWGSSRAGDKAGETRTFYGVGGDKTVVAVGLGKSQSRDENVLKEQARKSVSTQSPPLLAISS